MTMQVRFTNQPRLQVRVVALPGSSSSGAVDSVFGRTGAVVAVTGDYAVAQVTGAAPTDSPALTGVPTAPTAGTGTNTTQIATCEFVRANAGSGTFSGAPLKEVDDTNITLAWSGGSLTAVGGGTVTLTAGWTSTLAVSRGGIGTGTLTSNAVLLGAGTSTIVPLAPGGTGTVLTSPGGGAAPTWSAAGTGSFSSAPLKEVDDTNVTAALSGATATCVNGTVTITLGWTGTLAVGRGGVGTGTLTSNGVLIGSGTGAVSPLAAAGSGTVLTGVSSSAPAFTTTLALGVAGASLGQLVLAGNTTGTITIQGQAAAGTYNFNLPQTAGTAGLPLLSAGGGASPQTYGTLSVAGGGSGTGSLTANGVLIGNGTSAIAPLAQAASGTVLTGVASAAPAFTSTLQLGVGGSQIGRLVIGGNTSGSITIQPQAAAGTYNFNMPTTAGNSGDFLTSGGGTATVMTWTAPSVVSGAVVYNATQTITQAQQAVALRNIGAAQFNLVNGSLVESRGAGAATFAIKGFDGNDPSISNPVFARFPDGTLRAATAALSLTIVSGATMGFLTATPGRLWFAIADNAGTMTLVARNCVAATTNAVSVRDFSPNILTAASMTVASDSDRISYAGSALTSVEWTRLGYADYEAGLAGTGTWDVAPTRIQLYAPGQAKPGDCLRNEVVQSTSAFTTTSSSYVDTNLSGALGQFSGCNCMKLTAVGPLYSHDNVVGVYGRIYRGSTGIGPEGRGYTTAGGESIWPWAAHTLDYSGSSATVTWSVRIHNDGGVGSVAFGFGSAVTEMHFEEIMG